MVRQREGGGVLETSGWVGVQTAPPPPPSRGGGTFLGLWGGFLFYPLGGVLFYPLSAVLISRHSMKIFCECGPYVADLEKAQREVLKSAEHKSRVAASTHAGALGDFIKHSPLKIGSNAHVLCVSLVVGWVGGWVTSCTMTNQGNPMLVAKRHDE